MNLGKYNFWFGRLLSQGNRFVQPINFLMLIFLTAQQEPLAWGLIPLGLLFSLVWVGFDKKRVLCDELIEGFDRNPRMVEMQNDLKDLKEELKEIKGLMRLK